MRSQSKLSIWKMLKKYKCLSEVMKYSFPNWLFDHWNGFDKEVVHFKNLNEFKTKWPSDRSSQVYLIFCILQLGKYIHTNNPEVYSISSTYWNNKEKTKSTCERPSHSPGQPGGCRQWCQGTTSQHCGYTPPHVTLQELTQKQKSQKINIWVEMWT